MIDRNQIHVKAKIKRKMNVVERDGIIDNNLYETLGCNGSLTENQSIHEYMLNINQTCYEYTLAVEYEVQGKTYLNTAVYISDKKSIDQDYIFLTCNKDEP